MTSFATRTIGHYLEALAAPTPAPGGGSVAGLVGALAASLGRLVANLTDRAAPQPSLASASEKLAGVTTHLLATAEQDESCYPAYLAASRLPKATAAEKAARREAMQDAIVHAAEVPLGLATSGAEVLALLEPVAREGTAHAASDTAIGINLAEAAVIAALSNVRANIPLIKHAPTAERFTVAANSLESRATSQAARLREILTSR
jgi:formiminotetrahydrofolate cyclodeaminase